MQTLPSTETNTVTKDIVAKLWSLCHILRDDGITYQNYVTELTYLLFLKMLAETGRENLLPEGYRWVDLHSLEGEKQLTHYKQMLLDLGNPNNAKVSSARVRAIFADAQTALRKPANLKALTDAIDRLEWFAAREEGLGNLYEGLLEKNAAEKKSGAGQYFTPRPLIDSIVRLLKPKAGEVIQDPAAGTGGFLVAADHYIKQQTDDLYTLSEAQQHFQRAQAFVGLELVPDTHRLCLMNLMLHGIDGGVECGDTLSPDGQNLPKADLIMTNPPFGTKKGGGGPTRNDFSITASSNNKQLTFVEHIFRAMKPGARAAVVVPDNVLFDETVGRRLRNHLMDTCNLHTILRLPIGIFYAQTVQTNVIFFTRAKTDKKNTQGVWFYDMRTNMPSFGKTRPLYDEDFEEFQKCFGDDPLCGAEALAARKDLGDDGRFRYYSREDISKNEDKLDLLWLKDENAPDPALYRDPHLLAQEVLKDLQQAVTAVQGIIAELGEPVKGLNGALPPTWAETTLGQLSTQASQRQPDSSETFTYIDISAIDRENKEIVEPQELLGSEAPSRARQVLSTGDVLVSMTRPNLNAVAIVPEDLDGQIASTGFDVLRAVGIEPRWLYYLVRSEKFVSAMTDLVQGALYPAVRPKDIRGFTAPLAPLREQDRIVSKLDAIVEKTQICKTNLNTALEQISRLTAASITKAYKAELVPHDPTDEPASELLKQIIESQETKKASPKKKGRKT